MSALANAEPAADAPMHLRVAADKVSRLLDLVAELSLTVSETVQSPDLAGLDLQHFESSAHRLKLVVREVQNVAADLRLVPIGELMRRMKRLVRELERQTGKEVDLELVGDEIEVDKLIVDRLFEPLVHMVRNSVDHGLEAPEARVAAGKPRRGVVRLSAAQIGGEVQIAIEDDGRGLDRARILKRARERGLIDAREEPRDEELWPVIFEPGFSTAETITNLSGRGVGMDVINHTVRALHGRLDVTSRAGKGATVTLAIPLSLAFLDCVVVRIGASLFATPIDAVAEILQPETGQVASVSAADEQVVAIRGAHVPILRLERFYNLQAQDDGAARTLVVFTAASGRVALPIDEMLGQQQVIMKPLVGRFEGIRGGLGWALLGTGEVALVLDVAKIVK